MATRSNIPLSTLGTSYVNDIQPHAIISLTSDKSQSEHVPSQPLPKKFMPASSYRGDYVDQKLMRCNPPKKPAPRPSRKLSLTNQPLITNFTKSSSTDNHPPQNPNYMCNKLSLPNPIEQISLSPGPEPPQKPCMIGHSIVDN